MPLHLRIPPPALRRLAALALSSALALSPALPALADSVSGASVDSFTLGTFQINCTTCGHYDLPIVVRNGLPTSAGGAGYSQAAIDYVADGSRGLIPLDYTVGGGLTAAAWASFEGAAGTPLLKARAFADNVPVFIPASDPDVEIGVDSYQVSANARTVRQYQYTGAAAASYTFTFSVDGWLSDQRASVFGSAAIYANADTGFETGLISFGSKSVQGTGLVGAPTHFDESFAVTVNVNPGDSFYLIGNLGALANNDIYSSGDVSANAYDTLRVTQITGNTQALVAGPVPEASRWVGLLIGLAAVLGLARRRGTPMR